MRIVTRGVRMLKYCVRDRFRTPQADAVSNPLSVCESATHFLTHFYIELSLHPIDSHPLATVSVRASGRGPHLHLHSTSTVRIRQQHYSNSICSLYSAGADLEIMTRVSPRNSSFS